MTNYRHCRPISKNCDLKIILSHWGREEGESFKQITICSINLLKANDMIQNTLFTSKNGCMTKKKLNSTKIRYLAQNPIFTNESTVIIIFLPFQPYFSYLSFSSGRTVCGPTFQKFSAPVHPQRTGSKVGVFACA
jgi:hypothetical protein